MAKIGKCVNCGPSSADKPLIAGRCQLHYWQHRQKVNSKKPNNIAKELRKKDNSVFFASQFLVAPSRCENCGTSLAPTISTFGPRSIVAHIVPKRPIGGCASVSLHPLNRWFGCIDCHNNYDNKGAAFALTMPALPLIRERFSQFREDIVPAERKNIPSFLFSENE